MAEGPLTLRMWEPDGASKLEMAKNMILGLNRLLKERRVVLLAASWYSKAPLTDLLKNWDGRFDFVWAARIDTAMFGLKPARTGKRGAPAKKGARVRPEDIELFPCGRPGLLAGHRRALTRLFGWETPMAVVETMGTGPSASRRLYLSTLDMEELAGLMTLGGLASPAVAADAWKEAIQAFDRRGMPSARPPTSWRPSTGLSRRPGKRRGSWPRRWIPSGRAWPPRRSWPPPGPGRTWTGWRRWPGPPSSTPPGRTRPPGRPGRPRRRRADAWPR